MLNLSELQQWLLDDIYRGTNKTSPFIEDKHHNRLGIYRNNAYLTLIDCLEAFFPVTLQVVGGNFFKKMAKAYIQKHPPHSGDINTSGDQFALFAKSYDEINALPYLPDLMKLENAFLKSSIARSLPALDFNNLNEKMLTDNSFSLKLQETALIIDVSYNVLDIWQAHQNENVEHISLENTEHSILIWRNADYEILMRSLTKAEAVFLRTCDKQQSFADAIENALSVEPQVEVVQASFAEFLQCELFIK